METIRRTLIARGNAWAMLKNNPCPSTLEVFEAARVANLKAVLEYETKGN